MHPPTKASLSRKRKRASAELPCATTQSYELKSSDLMYLTHCISKRFVLASYTSGMSRKAEMDGTEEARRG
jgi:hypothetical protein